MAPAAEACRDRLRHTLAYFDDDVRVLALGVVAQRALGITADRWQPEALTGKQAIGTKHPAAAFKDERGGAMVFIEEVFKKLTAPPPFHRHAPNYHVVRDVEELPDPSWWHGPICVDIETTGKQWWNTYHHICLIGVSHMTNGRVTGWIIPEHVFRAAAGKAWLHNLWAMCGTQIGGHNFGFDMLWLHQEFNLPIKFGWDTMLMANIYNGHWHKGLKPLCGYFYDVPDWSVPVKQCLKSLPKERRHFGNVPSSIMYPYLAADIHYNLELYGDLKARLATAGTWDMPYKGCELPLARELCHMELRGFPVDMARVRFESHRLGEQVKRLAQQIYEDSGQAIENPNSYVQIAAYLYDNLGLRHTAKLPARSTAKGALDTLDNELARLILDYRRVAKLKNSYLDNLHAQVHPTVYDDISLSHASYQQAHVISGRMSARKPAIQTIPKQNRERDGDADYGRRIKDCYVARPEYTLVCVDGSQWELRVAAAWSQDPWLLDAYNSGMNVHSAACDMMYGAGKWDKAMRTKEKNVMFGLIYGGTLEGIITSAGIVSGDAARVFEFFSSELRGLMDWRAEMFELARTKGEIVSPYFNRVFHFPFVHRGNQHAVEKYAVNYIVQGTASNITLDAAARAGPSLRDCGAYLIAAVHDELVAEAPYQFVNAVARNLGNELCLAGHRAFPSVSWAVEAEQGTRWGSLVSLEME
jgi:DNA polymerase I-like protein with 3'-5' exonuclease and polymerase domains